MRRVARLGRVAGCVLALACACGNALAKDPKDVRVEDLSFMTGRWHGGSGEISYEEIWSGAEGGTMMCVFRFLKSGRPLFYEICVIEASPDGPVLRIRHFDPGLIGWEERTVVNVFPLKEFGKDRAVFEEAGAAKRLTYSRTADGGYSVVLEKKAAGGTVDRSEFLFRAMP